VLRFFRDFMADAPDEVGIMANLRLAPALPVFPEELQGRPIVALIVCYAGPVDEGERMLRPLRQFKALALDTVTRKACVAHQAMFDPAYPHGRHYYWRAWKLPPLTDGATDVIVQQGDAITSPLSAIPLFILGGAVARVDDDATAFTGRSAAHDINFVASWLPNDSEPERHKARARPPRGRRPAGPPPAAVDLRQSVPLGEVLGFRGSHLSGEDRPAGRPAYTLTTNGPSSDRHRRRSRLVPGRWRPGERSGAEGDAQIATRFQVELLELTGDWVCPRTSTSDSVPLALLTPADITVAWVTSQRW
jgi:hypothetical protein